MALNITAAIEARGMKLKECADKMNVSYVTLYKHINGNPSVKVLQKIADTLDCDIVELFDEPAVRRLGREVVTPVKFCPNCGAKIEGVMVKQ